jgi:hypothetical protein
MVTVNTSGDYINRTIMVYTNCAAASSVACDFRSVSFPGDAGTTYWILVGAIYETEFRGNVVATVCEMPHIQSTNSYALLESEGVRVYYSASATGAGSLNYNWSFFDANDGFMFSANGQTVSRLFGPFDSFPARFNVSVSNGCTNDGTGGTFPPPCGAICLSVGIPSTRTGTNGAGLNSYSLSSSCGTFAPGNSRWFLMSKLTNAAGMAFVSSEGSAADTMLGIFRGGINPATLFPLACSASSNNLPARVEFETRPGSNYWLAVITTNPAALKLTYGYDVKVASFTLDSSNRTVDLRSAPVPSLQYQLLCSTNLSSNPADWSVLLTTNFSTNISASNNVLRFLDTNISTNRQRFYRLSLLP